MQNTKKISEPGSDKLKQLKEKLASQMESISKCGNYFHFTPFTCDELKALLFVARKIKLKRSDILPGKYVKLNLSDLGKLCDVHLFSAKAVERIYSFLAEQTSDPNKKKTYFLLGTGSKLSRTN